MFNAKLKSGTIISLVDEWPVEELKELRNKSGFYCPACQLQVMLKVGQKKQWHFSHYSNEKCEYLPEAETMYHLKGKKHLYDWLKKQQIEVKMELYLPLIRQRPDLIFRYKQNLYAIEFQCSPIDTNLIEKRTNGYLQQGIFPIWILGGNRLKRNGTRTFTLKSFEWFATKTLATNNYRLSYYCPEQEKISHLHQITPFSSKKVIAAYEETSLHQTSIEHFLYSVKEPPLDEWLTIKKHWRYHHPTPYPSQTERFYRQLLYRHQIPPSLFPIEAGWATNNHYLIESSPYLWQTFLLLECLQFQPLHKPFSSRLAVLCLQALIRKGIFPHRQVQNHLDWTLAIDGFFCWLVQVNYLKCVSKDQDTYFRLRDVVIPKTSEQAIVLDQKFAHQLIKMESSC